MGSEKKPTEKPRNPQNAAPTGYVPPPLQSATKQQSPATYVPPSVSEAGQYSPPQYIPPAITPSQASYVDPMAPVGSAMPPTVTPPVAYSNPTQNDSTDYLAAERTSTPFADIPTRTIFLPRKSNPILGFIIVGLIGMMGIVIVGLVVALSKNEEAKRTSIALNIPKEQSVDSKKPTPAQSATNTDAKTESRKDFNTENQEEQQGKRIDPPVMQQNIDPPRMERDKFRNDRPNRPKGMGNKNRPRQQTDDLPTNKPKDEPKQEMEKMPATVPATDSAAQPDNSKMPAPSEPENKRTTPAAPATVEPAKPVVVANQESRIATPEQEQEFFNSLKKIRAALEARDFDTAKKEQEKVDQLAISDDMKTMAEGMDMVSQYNKIFWKFVQDAMRNLNGEVEIGSLVAFVVTSNSESMTVRMQGKNRDFSFNTLPVGLAVAIAKKTMNDDPANRATLASFYFTHPKLEKLKDTKELLSTAKKGGVKTDPVLFLLEKEHLISTKQ